jgi:hypothetical protein
MANQIKRLQRLLSVCMASLMVFTLVFVGGEAQALALDEALTSANKSYLSSVLKDYAKGSQDTYGSSLKQAQKLVNGLAEQLEKAADPDVKEADRASILAKVNSSKAALSDLAASFNGLATETETFDTQLQTSLEDLLKFVKGNVRSELTQNEDNFKTIASTLTDLATNAAKVNENNLTDLLGSVGDNITTLNTAFDLGTKALKSVSLLAK